MSGTIYETCTSLPFGDGQSCTGTDMSPMHLTGKQRDTESSLDYFGARYYTNQMGRWMSPDEAFADQHPPDPQSWNLYSYTRDNPLRNIDPNGRGVIDWQAVSQAVRNWFSGGVARDGGVGNFAKNNVIGAAKGAGTFALNTARAVVAAGQATSPGGTVGAVQTMTAPLPVALTASNQTQAQAFNATQVGLAVASVVVPIGGEESAATSTVTHFTNDVGMAGISQSGTVDALSWVTLPSEIPCGSSSSAVESILELSPGKASNSITFGTPSSTLAIPGNGPATSGGATQFQLIKPQPINPADFKPTPQ